MMKNRDRMLWSRNREHANSSGPTKQSGSRLVIEALESRCVLAASAPVEDPAVDADSIPSSQRADSILSTPDLIESDVLESSSTNQIDTLSRQNLPDWAESRLVQDRGRLLSAYQALGNSFLVHYEDALGRPEILFQDGLLTSEVSLVDFLEQQVGEADPPGFELAIVTDIQDLELSVGSDDSVAGTLLEVTGRATVWNGFRSEDANFVISIATESSGQPSGVRPRGPVQGAASLPDDFVGPRTAPDAFLNSPTDLSQARFEPLPLPNITDRFRITFFGSSGFATLDDRDEDQFSRPLPDDESELTDPLPDDFEEYGQSPRDHETPKSLNDDKEDGDSDVKPENGLPGGHLEMSELGDEQADNGDNQGETEQPIRGANDAQPADSQKGNESRPQRTETPRSSDKEERKQDEANIPVQQSPTTDTGHAETLEGATGASAQPLSVPDGQVPRGPIDPGMLEGTTASPATFNQLTASHSALRVEFETATADARTSDYVVAIREFIQSLISFLIQSRS